MTLIIVRGEIITIHMRSDPFVPFQCNRKEKKRKEKKKKERKKMNFCVVVGKKIKTKFLQSNQIFWNGIHFCFFYTLSRVVLPEAEIGLSLCTCSSLPEPFNLLAEEDDAPPAFKAAC